MNPDFTRSELIQVACSCGHLEEVERLVVLDEAARPGDLAELAENGVRAGSCSRCGAELSAAEYFAVLRPSPVGTVCFVFSESMAARANHEELVGKNAAARTIPLPAEAAPVVLSRDLRRDLADPKQAAAETSECFGPELAGRYSALLDEVALIEVDRRAAALVDLLVDVKDERGFTSLIASEPAVLGDELLGYLERLATLDAFNASLQMTSEMLIEAREDAPGAWRRYQARVSAEKGRNERLKVNVAALERLGTEERWEEATSLGVATLAEARDLGHGILAAAIHSQLGVALVRSSGGDRRAAIEAAIDHFGEAIKYAPSKEIRGRELVNLAGAYGQRLQGDPNENFEQSLKLLRRAEPLLDREAEPREWSTLQTNLCRSLQVRESGDRVENLRSALRHCRLALEERSPEIGGEDWAYSTINLGITLELLAAEGKADISDARAALDEVVAERERVGRDFLVAQALGGLGAIDRAEAQQAGKAGEPERSEGLQKDAVGRLEEAVELLAKTEHNTLQGLLLNDLATALSRLGDRSSAIVRWRAALALARPESDPIRCQEIGSSLGGALAATGDWDGAAAAYRDAVNAAELSFQARIFDRGRQAEIRRQGNLARWASYALARSGAHREALEVLEAGRARELSRRIGGRRADAEVLEGIPEELAAAYLRAGTALRSAALGDDSSGASGDLQRAIAEIRSLPGHEQFGKASGWKEIEAAVEPGVPLVYLNPTPGGMVLFCLSHGADGKVELETRFRESPSGDEVSAFIAGNPGHSYIAAASELYPGEDLAFELESLLPWLGEQFCAPLAAYLKSKDADVVTIIACGLIGLAPIHAGTWLEDGEMRVLLETCEVRHAASAALHAESLRNREGARERASRLLALGNPSGASLEAAEGEVAQIAGGEWDRPPLLAIGAEAHSQFLLTNAAEASHLHLACHAKGAAFDLEQSGIELSDRGVSARELAGVGPLQARLTVASACQTAISEIRDLPDEVLSISSVLLAAGSACVIASLWSVNDYATALLMTKLYEELGDKGVEPSVALRRAQLWLAHLDRDAEATYLEARPTLKAAFANRDRRRHPAHWTSSAPSIGAEENRYSHPVFWAPFIVVGA